MSQKITLLLTFLILLVISPLSRAANNVDCSVVPSFVHSYINGPKNFVVQCRNTTPNAHFASVVLKVDTATSTASSWISPSVLNCNPPTGSSDLGPGQICSTQSFTFTPLQNGKYTLDYQNTYSGITHPSIFCSTDKGCIPMEVGTIGVIQYNVKAGQGGWDDNGPVTHIQADLIADTIKKKNVDFVILQSADAPNAGTPNPLISDLLTARNLLGWTTVTSQCDKDVTQLAYQAADWTPIGGSVANRGWLSCSGGESRPYNLVYFQNVHDANLKVLVVSSHMPHSPQIPVQNWLYGQFLADARTVSGENDLSKVKLVFAGDMNEIGPEAVDSSDYNYIFYDFRVQHPLSKSPNLGTCCANSNFNAAFDHVITNGQLLDTVILLPQGGYPIPTTYPGTNEQHKAIYSSLVFGW